ncbi:hypothetical protein C2869_12455 [Saccharobesus litoralis]|uniref:Potassium channel domain-containing protein n=1 Tax=Saccharobesus litoralis TaxID=2172099 RepID=A0A2S0VSJ8_9ALTE|nr:ion channel [Saccharobesus litoralis]AWB67196.1 hypothetical protein C2869_12455 [Saccharobesus litoralis]
MSVFSLFVRKLVHHFSRVSWKSLTLIAGLHYGIGYLICDWTAQDHIVDTWYHYFHFWIVTISTVGYGDFYAQGGWNTIFVDIWFIGFGLGLFGSLLGKTAEFIFQLINRHVQGMKNFSSLTDHIIIFSNSRLDAQRIIELLLADANRVNRTILFCTTQSDIPHPMPEHESVEFARLTDFKAEDEMVRINLYGAKRVIISTDSDDENLALTVHVTGLVNESCHIATHFDDENNIESLERLKLPVECSTSNRVEQLVRASQDHGTTAIINQLLNTKVGMTLFVARVDNIDTTFGELKSRIYQTYGADVIGIALDELGKSLEILPTGDTQLSGTVFIHYLYNQRLQASYFS